jgi:hypothetical protein
MSGRLKINTAHTIGSIAMLYTAKGLKARMTTFFRVIRRRLLIQLSVAGEVLIAY